MNLVSQSRRRKLSEHVFPSREQWLRKRGFVRHLAIDSTDEEMIPVGDVVRWLSLVMSSSEALESLVFDASSAADLRSKMEMVESVLKRRASSESEEQAMNGGFGERPETFNYAGLPVGNVRRLGGDVARGGRKSFGEMTQEERHAAVNEFLGKR